VGVKWRTTAETAVNSGMANCAAAARALSTSRRWRSNAAASPAMSSTTLTQAAGGLACSRHLSEKRDYKWSGARCRGNDRQHSRNRRRQNCWNSHLLPPTCLYLSSQTLCLLPAPSPLSSPPLLQPPTSVPFTTPPAAYSPPVLICYLSHTCSVAYGGRATGGASAAPPLLPCCSDFLRMHLPLLCIACIPAICLLP